MMKAAKKIMATLLAASIAFGFSACGTSGAGSTSSSAASTAAQHYDKIVL